MSDQKIPHTSSDIKLWFGSFSFVASFMLGLYLFFEPRWATNDDVAMAMAAGGYGLAVTETSNLIFSNVVWGHVVRLVPELWGTSGYSIATIAVLIGVGTVIMHGLVRLGLGNIGAALAVVLILTRAVLLPQFTINAGLLMAGAVICWQLYARHDEMQALLLGCLFAFLSYLIRSLEFVLVLTVASPLLPWKALGTRRMAQIAALALAAAIAASALANHRAYQGAEWSTFKALDAARTPYTDFRADARLKQRPDILERHKYSLNDIDLLGNWFFVDQALADPVKLNAMLAELGPLPDEQFAWTNVSAGMQIFWKSGLTSIFLAAFLLALLRPDWRTAGAWVLCIAAIFGMSVAGRPGMVRVCLPLACLLLIAPFFSTRQATKASIEILRQRMILVVLLFAALSHSSRVLLASRNIQTVSESDRQGLDQFPTHPVIVWGDAFPFEAAYPVIGQPVRADRFRLYGLGVMNWAPFTVSYSEHRQGRGLIELLTGEPGVQIVAKEAHLSYLATYCKEHLQGTLDVVSLQHFGKTKVHTVSCPRGSIGQER